MYQDWRSFAVGFVEYAAIPALAAMAATLSLVVLIQWFTS
jgi:hypothetical protein